MCADDQDGLCERSRKEAVCLADDWVETSRAKPEDCTLIAHPVARALEKSESSRLKGRRVNTVP